MRSLVYWSVAMAVAVLVAHAAANPHDDAETTVLGTVVNPGFAVPEERALLLGLGILAIAYTYQRVWLNLKKA